MALRSVDERKGGSSSSTSSMPYVDPGKVSKGETIEGNLVRFEDRDVAYQGKKFKSRDMILKNDKGEFSVSGKGSIKYFEKDFLESKKVRLGDYIVLTRWNEDAKTPRFNVEVDDEKAIKVETKHDF